MDLLTIHFLLNLPGIFACVYFNIKDLFWLLYSKLGRWDHTQVLLKFISMLGISQICIGMHYYLWNMINSILSIRIYIITAAYFSPTILLSLHTCILLRSIKDIHIMIRSLPSWTLTSLAQISFTGLITCSASFSLITTLISTNNIFKLCIIVKLKESDREQLHGIWSDMESFMSSPCVYNPIYSLSNSSCSKIHMNINVQHDCSFWPLFFWVKSVGSSQRLTLWYKAWICMGDVPSPFSAQQITMMKVELNNSARLLLAFMHTHFHKSVSVWLWTRLQLLPSLRPHVYCSL